MTTATRSQTQPLRTPEDVVALRKLVRDAAVSVGMSLVEQTKVVTAASELGRNTIIHGGGGSGRVEVVTNGSRKGVRMYFEDTGPGIADLALALRDGFTSGGGLGLGLPGSKRLLSEFEIDTAPGQGTRITGVRWSGG
ncbi:MAG: anti-sigma regulatory factor [Phycisphaerales bacterium]